MSPASILIFLSTVIGFITPIIGVTLAYLFFVNDTTPIFVLSQKKFY